jgi:site-specific DNA-methyltransferase (adenine-specific)
MPRNKTKTSSFGTSKREGHDATQFYSSNLYSGLAINENQKRVDNSDRLDPACFTDHPQFSLDSLKSMPDYSLHLAILDTSALLPMHDFPSFFETKVMEVLHEVARLLVTGGRIAVIIDNSALFVSSAPSISPTSTLQSISPALTFPSASSSASSIPPPSPSLRQFYPFHIFFTSELIRLGLLMRGEVIWKKPVSPAGLDAGKQPFPNFESAYKRILIFSKGVMKREKLTNVDTITRDQFLQYTKSIWNSQPELSDHGMVLAAPSLDLLECWNHLLQLYTFREDKILMLAAKSPSEIRPLLRSIRPNMISYSLEP